MPNCRGQGQIPIFGKCSNLEICNGFCDLSETSLLKMEFYVIIVRNFHCKVNGLIHQTFRTWCSWCEFHNPHESSLLHSAYQTKTLQGLVDDNYWLLIMYCNSTFEILNLQFKKFGFSYMWKNNQTFSQTSGKKIIHI